MNLSENVLQVITILVVSSLIVSAAAWISLTPRPSEPFFALYVLGENMKAEQYYPDDDPNIDPGELVRWYTGVYNHMGSVQYVSVRVRLLNSTSPAPDSIAHVPSSFPAFMEFRYAILDNETWWFPLFWCVQDITVQGDRLAIDSLVVNNVTVTHGLDAHAVSGHNFRIVLELWVYNVASHQFEFAWESGQEERSAWNQIWFNMTTS